MFCLGANDTLGYFRGMCHWLFHVFAKPWPILSFKFSKAFLVDLLPQLATTRL